MWTKEIVYWIILNKNINATCNYFKDFTELQFIWGNQSIEINSLGPNLWISHDWEYRYVSVGHRYLKNNWPHNGPQDLVMVFLCIQIAIDQIQLCSLFVAYACPYHNPTATMGALFSQRWRQPSARPHNANHVVCCCEASWTYCQILKKYVGGGLLFRNAHSIHWQQLWWTFLQSACQLHAPSKHETSVPLCYVTKFLWPFVVPAHGAPV